MGVPVLGGISTVAPRFYKNKVKMAIFGQTKREKKRGHSRPRLKQREGRKKPFLAWKERELGFG